MDPSLESCNSCNIVNKVSDGTIIGVKSQIGNLLDVFIVLEGPEGAGKTTLALGLKEALSPDREVVLTREPGEGPFGRQIRALLLEGNAMTARAELFLFLADRAHHVEEFIRPALERSAWVICDRFMDSTFVYQSVARGLNPEFVNSANLFAVNGLMPDLRILLDLEPEVGLARQERQDRLDREPLEFHRKVRLGFLELARSEPNWVVINAQESPEHVLRLALEAIATLKPDVH
jgi:dTMP kinase